MLYARARGNVTFSAAEKIFDGIGIRIYEKQRDLEMTLYLYALDKRYNLREIIREARKRPEMAYIFDDPEDE